jgi:hypothetical protein
VAEAATRLHALNRFPALLNKAIALNAESNNPSLYDLRVECVKMTWQKYKKEEWFLLEDETETICMKCSEAETIERFVSQAGRRNRRGKRVPRRRKWVEKEATPPSPVTETETETVHLEDETEAEQPQHRAASGGDTL